MREELQSRRSRYRWLVLGVSLFAFVAYAFSFQSAPPLIQSVKAEFSIRSDAEVALLMSIVLVPGIFLSLPAGLWIGKFGVKQVGVLSLIGVVLGDFISASANSFLTLLIGRFILGLGGALVMTATPAIVGQWFSKDDLGKAMGIFGVNMPLATVTALPAASALLVAYGWRFPFYVSTVVAIAALLVYLAVVKDGPYVQHEVRGNMRQAVVNREVWKVGIVWLFFNAAALSFITWAPTLFEEFQNAPTVQASLLASLFMWCTILFVPFFGYLSDRMGTRRPFIIVGFILMALALTLVGSTSNTALIPSILFLGTATAMIPPIVSALPAQVLGPDLAGVGFGITATCLNIGAALAQPSIGYVRDATQAYAPCLLVMAILSAVGAIFAYTLKPS